MREHLLEVLDPEAPVVRLEQLEHSAHLIRRCPALRGPTDPPVDQPRRTLRIVAIAQPTKVSLAYPQLRRRLLTD